MHGTKSKSSIFTKKGSKKGYPQNGVPENIAIIQTRVHDQAVVASPSPDSRKTEYLCVSDDGRLVIYVTASAYDYTLESFRFFIGDGNTMRELKITNVNRLNDGGTTYIQTEDLEFYSPAPRYMDDQPDWGRTTKLNFINPAKVEALYDVVADASGLVTSVTKKRYHSEN